MRESVHGNTSQALKILSQKCFGPCAGRLAFISVGHCRYHQEVHPVDHRIMNGTPRGSAGPAGGPGKNNPQQDQIAAQCQAFDYDTAERAKIVREHEVLEPPTDGILKNEDEITKKWIALI